MRFRFHTQNTGECKLVKLLITRLNLACVNSSTAAKYSETTVLLLLNENKTKISQRSIYTYTYCTLAKRETGEEGRKKKRNNFLQLFYIRV